MAEPHHVNAKGLWKANPIGNRIGKKIDAKVKGRNLSLSLIYRMLTMQELQMHHFKIDPFVRMKVL